MTGQATCIRRARSYWTTCRCGDCIRDRARKRKQQSMGVTYRVPHAQAWAVLAAKIDAGWTARALGSATGLGPAYFDSHVAQRRRGLEVFLVPAAADAIMRMGVPTEGQIGAEPSRRRLRALAAIGYGINTLSEETGINFSTLAEIRNNAVRVGASRAITIAAAYDRLHTIPGDDEQAARIAREKRWTAPLGWDDIDDLDEIPAGNYKGRNPRDTSSSEDYDEVRVLRILSGDYALASQATTAERRDVVARWPDSLAELERRTGWQTNRYVTRGLTA